MKSRNYLLMAIALLPILAISQPSLAQIASGDVAPLGNRDGIVNVGDALVALRFALGLEIPTQEDIDYGDVAPLDANGHPSPDGVIAVGDALVILRKALGLVSWPIPATLESIALTPEDASVPEGNTLQFTAIGTYSDDTSADITAQVTWSSSDETIATVSNADENKGLATAVSYGTTTITATREGVEGSTSLTVTAPAAFELESSAFVQSSTIPAKYTCDGTNVSPPLSWSNSPADVRSFALIMKDDDAPGGTWDHWIMYDIPPTTTSLEENAGVSGGGNLPAGAKHGTNSWGNNYYEGPCPPFGTHRYDFVIYALSVEKLNPIGTEKSDILTAMTGKVLDQAEYMGTYASP